MASVSVIVPCYNYGAFLPACVDSVLSQDGVDVRVLVIDDESSDATPEVGARLAARDGRVEFLRHRQNQGHIATYNEGLAWASQDYTILLSADDLLTPGALQRAAHVMDRHPEVGLVYGPAAGFATGEQPPVPKVGPEVEWEVLDGFDWFERVCGKAENPIGTAAVVVRTSLQHRLGGYRMDLPHAGDLEMWMRFAMYGPLAKITNAGQGLSRFHAGSMQAVHFSAPVARLEQRKAAFEVIFDQYGRQIPDCKRRRGAVNRALAADALWLICRGAFRRELAVTPVADLVDFAARTYRASEAEAPQRSGSNVRRVGQLLHLVRPFLHGALRWPRAWLQPKLHALRTP